MLGFSYVNEALYRESLTNLRKHLKTKRSGSVDIQITPYDGAANLLEVRLNRHNLYIDGFRKSPDGLWYYFKDATPWAGAKPLPYGGAHRDLQTDQSTTLLNGAAKFKFDQIINYAGEKADTLRLGLGFLVVTLSEATRFTAIENNVASCVAGVTSYAPQKDHKSLMSNWQTLSSTSPTPPGIPIPYPNIGTKTVSRKK